MKALIFGASGQDGHYLHALCQAKSMESIGIARSGPGEHGDIGDFEQVESLIKLHRPDYIFHLAANSTTRHDALFENHRTIATGSLNILESAWLHSPGSRIFITGSGIQFKNTGESISEQSEFEAHSQYAVCRIQSVYAARYYRRLGLPVYVGYLFHHESPWRKPHHVSQMIASAVKRIKNGSNEIIEIGDMSVKKEWTFAGDVVQAILTLVEQDKVSEAVIGSGIGYTIEDWLEECFSLIGKDWRPFVHLAQGFKPEYECLVSNPATIKSLSWSPRVSFAELAKMMTA